MSAQRQGTWMILLVRLDALEAAIRHARAAPLQLERWAALEREYDRVRRAATKGAQVEEELAGRRVRPGPGLPAAGLAVSSDGRTVAPFAGVVHVLAAGRPLCGGLEGPPAAWPTGHAWVRQEEVQGATCPPCLEAEARR